MDLTLDVGEYKLNVRAAAVIIHNNKILMHKNVNKDHYGLIGGRVEIGESSEETVKREIKEELNKEIEITGYISTVENFFTMNGKKYHEILFIYKAEFKDEENRKLEEVLENKEGKDYLKYYWIDLDKIDTYKIMPEILKEILKVKKYPLHEIFKK